MGLEKSKCYSAECDKCKKQYTNGNGFVIFLDKISLLEELDQSEWVNQGGYLFCSDCEDYEEDSDTLLDLKPKNND